MPSQKNQPGFSESSLLNLTESVDQNVGQLLHGQQFPLFRPGEENCHHSGYGHLSSSWKREEEIAVEGNEK